MEEVAHEAAAAVEGDVEPEEHLTGRLLDSAHVKGVAAEMTTTGKAADTDKS